MDKLKSCWSVLEQDTTSCAPRTAALRPPCRWDCALGLKMLYKYRLFTVKHHTQTVAYYIFRRPHPRQHNCKPSASLVPAQWLFLKSVFMSMSMSEIFFFVFLGRPGVWPSSQTFSFFNPAFSFVNGVKSMSVYYEEQLVKMKEENAWAHFLQTSPNEGRRWGSSGLSGDRESLRSIKIMRLSQTKNDFMNSPNT